MHLIPEINTNTLNYAFLRLLHNESTQAQGCGEGGSMRACHTAGPDSIPGRGKFPGRGFFGAFLIRKTIVRKLKAPWFLECHVTIIIILIISTFFE